MASRTDAPAVVQTSEPPKLRLARRLSELFAYREILMNLIRKELKVKYTSSVLGAVWTMLNPVMYLAVFYFVFTVVLPTGIPAFPVYLLSGLLAWNLFSNSLSIAARSVVDNGNLVKKVYFPREILPLASVGASLVDFALQSLVLAGFLVAFQYSQPYGVNLLLLPLSLFALLVFTSAVALWVSALNVRYRDTQHLLGLTLLAWFWLTPVIYPSALVQEKLTQWSIGGISLFTFYLANPMAAAVVGFQRALYGVVLPVNEDGVAVPVLVDASVGWLAAALGLVTAGSIVLLIASWRTFFRLSGDFAEEL